MEKNEEGRHTMYIQDSHGIEITTQDYSIKLTASPGLSHEGILNGCIAAVDDDGKKIIDSNLISDGYHTFGELYEHRIALYIALCKMKARQNAAYNDRREWIEEADEKPPLVWKTKVHSDDSVWDGWFLLGVNHEKGKQITYHLPMAKWEECAFASEIKKAPEWDGHTSADVLERLKNFTL
jgi:hypothetical protein